MEVLKILKNKLESMKILENKLESLKLQENQPFFTVAETEGASTSQERADGREGAESTATTRKNHISRHGFDPSYKTWIHHGKSDLPPPPPVIDNTRQPQMSDMTACLNDQFFQNVFPPAKGYKLPPSYYAIKKTFKMIGLGYESIHACVNDYFLFQGDANKYVHFCLTINDFPARSSLFGWSGQGYRACPTCNEDTSSVRVLGKTDYVGHKRFIKKRHKWRSSLDFNGQIKDGDPPREFSRDAINLLDCPRQYLPSDVAKPLIELCLFFKQICSQTLMVNDTLKAQSKVVDIMCNLELIYPPAFSDIMIHLVIHLPLEAIEGGSIRPRWMYPHERFMKKLKNYVRNKDKPEGSIAEGYVAEKALTFSSYYFWDVTMKFNRPDRNVDCPHPMCQFQVFKSLCKSIGLRSVIHIDYQELKKVIWFVLHNSPEIDTYRAKFKSEFPNKDMKEEFPGWFGKQDEPDVIRVDNASHLVLSTSLNDLEIAALHIDGQSIDVDARSIIIDVDEDDDIIDEEDLISYDLADSNDKDLLNLDIDDDVARGHDDDGDGGGGGDDLPPLYRIPTGCGGCLGKGTRKSNLGGRRAGRMHTRQETRNLGLKAITDKNGPVSIRFEFGDRETLMPLGDHAAH
nr:hypothetical protein [Tanacetum cinerariifolium]